MWRTVRVHYVADKRGSGASFQYFSYFGANPPRIEISLVLQDGCYNDGLAPHLMEMTTTIKKTLNTHTIAHTSNTHTFEIERNKKGVPNEQHARKVVSILVDKKLKKTK